MPISTRLIKTKIKSVGNTRKITRAMEMVAASKMKRAVATAVATRPYTRTALNLLLELAREKHTEPHTLTLPGVSKRELIIMIASDRGLCGAFHTNLERRLRENLSSMNTRNIDFVCVGKNAPRVVKRAIFPQVPNLVGNFDKLPEYLSFEAVGGLTKLIRDEYVNVGYKQVLIYYTRHHSAMRQETRRDKLLPVSPNDLLDLYNDLAGASHKFEFRQTNMSQYVFEPGISEVMELVLPRLVDTHVYQSLLESRASEHSARMVAMRQAGDNAKELQESLSLSFNRARQEGVTREIAEITGGAEMLQATR